MFDFLFRRTAKQRIAVQPVVQPALSEIKIRQEQVRQTALAQAGTFDGQEAAAVEFILQCGFADARLIAAAFIHSQPLQQQVHSAMRNTDRRVARLLQGKIEAGLQLAKQEQRAQQSLEQAQRLLAEPQLMPNQVADLDRDWSTVDAAAGQTRQAFESVRTALHDRLTCQAQLQRAVIDALAEVRAVANALDTEALELDAGALDQLAHALGQHAAAAEAPALPKHLLPALRQELDAAQQKLAVITRAAQRAAPSAAPAASTITETQPALPEAEFASLATSVVPTECAEPQPAKPLAAATAPISDALIQELKQRFGDALDGMEKALEQGMLQAAAEHDKTLRAIDVKLCKPSAAQAPRLSRARTELAHLMGWARWGGNVSRDELLKTAEELSVQQLSLPELAKKIGSLRERWKSLDATAGASSRELWQRFDAGCNSAYEPLAIHYRQLAEERQLNAAKAQALLEQMQSLHVATQGMAENSTGVDWKNVAQQCQRIQQAWSRQGTIERKEKKRLDAEFAIAFAALAEPLAQQRRTAIEHREQLIAEASAIRADDRNAPELLRGLQASWQQQSLLLALERRDEQALWMRFRSACDAVFAKRKEAALAGEADRLQNLQQKEALCTQLESVTGEESPAALRKILRETHDGWIRIGYVPRAAEQQLTRRFDVAQSNLQQRIDALKRTAQNSELGALERKLLLCQEVEAAIAQAPQPGQGLEWAAQWEALAALETPLEQALQARFAAALTAWAANDSGYMAILEENRPQFGQELLRLEILMGCDSPPDLSRERLRMQVEVLQSSLQSGQAQMTQQDQLAVLTALPAATDAQDAQRIVALLQKMKSGSSTMYA